MSGRRVMVVRENAEKVEVVLKTNEGWDFTFSHDTGHNAWAVLLAASLRRRMYSDAAEEWQKAYDQGWADAKAKRAKVIW
jgi:hypothetical protein